MRRLLFALIIIIAMAFSMIAGCHLPIISEPSDDEAQEETIRSTIKVAASTSHSMAIRDDHSLWVWGENTFGQLGNGKTTTYHDIITISENNDLYVPTKLLDNIIDVAAGEGFSLAANDNGELFAWGDNDYGQFGNGNIERSTTPIKVMDNVKNIYACDSSVIAIKEDNTLWMWGFDLTSSYLDFNEEEGKYKYNKSPVKVMDNVKKAAIGSTCILMLDNDNSLYGIGLERELGIGKDDPNKTISTPVLILTDVKDIAASNQSYFAIMFNDDLYNWGFDFSTPTFISDDVKEVFPGDIFIKNDNSLWIWGEIYGWFSLRYTQDGLGYDGGFSIQDLIAEYGDIPIKIMDNVMTACGSSSHYMVVDQDANLFTWGDNQFGQLGNGKASVFGMEMASSYEDYVNYIYFYEEDNSVQVPTKIDW